MKSFIKKVVCVLVGLLLAVSMFGQNETRVLCDYCKGNGVVWYGEYDMYGRPVYYPCPKCEGKGYIVVSSGNSNISFKGKPVTLYSLHGGKSYATGTFYANQMVVVIFGTKFPVSKSSSKKWDYMVKFDNGDKWYFDY